METSKRIASKPGKTQLTLWGRVYLYKELFLPWLMERAWEVARGHPKGLPHAGEPPGDPEDTHQRLVRRGRQILKKNTSVLGLMAL